MPHYNAVVHATRPCHVKPRKSWDEVLLGDRKKFEMDTAKSQNRSEWRDHLRRPVKQRQHSDQDQGLLSRYNDDDDDDVSFLVQCTPKSVSDMGESFQY